MTGYGVSVENSALSASFIPATFRANSITATCIPKHSPKYGRLCVRAQLWGKAKDYFERCLARGPNPAAYLEYGKLLEHLGETEDALQKYKDGLLQATLLGEG